METSVQAPAAGVEYWPRRWVETVSDETLEVWKKQLGKKAEEVRGELARIAAGVAQLDAEIARRGESRKRRTETNGR